MEKCAQSLLLAASLTAVSTLTLDILFRALYMTVRGNFRCVVQHISTPSMVKNSSSSRAHANSCQRFVDIHIPSEGSHKNNSNNSNNSNSNHNNNNNTIWRGSVLTGEEPPPHSGELKRALPQAGGPTQSQLSRPMSSGHHITMEHRLRRKQLNSDTTASNKTYLKEIQEKKKRRNFFLRKK